MIYSINEKTTSRAIAIIIIALASLFTCQALKFIIFSVKEKRPVWKALFTTGGMPSSHTSTMISLMVSLGFLEIYYDSGIGYEFAVALALTAVVMYDACGVRYEAGKHAKILNSMIQSEEIQSNLKINKGKNLKELIGHKPLEVIGGLLYGIIIALIGVAIYIKFINI